MLSEQDKKDILADARDPVRRESFRKLRAIQETHRLTLDEYCDFCESMAQLFPIRNTGSRQHPKGDFRL